MFKRLSNRLVDYVKSYKAQSISELMGGGSRIIQDPLLVTGISNIECEEPVNIGCGSLIQTSRAKLIIKKHFVAGPHLTIVSGDHMPIIGKFIDDVTNADKNHSERKDELDKDIVINEDVWCGANVTILKGVTIGRGSIIASGAIVTRDLPPYCTAAGVPAKVVKFRWNVAEIMMHEKKLYPENERFSETYLKNIQSEYSTCYR